MEIKRCGYSEYIGELKAFISREDKKIRQENENIPRGKQERQPVGLIFNNLHRTISDWSRNDERVKTAFSRAVIRGKRSEVTVIIDY
jgi:hypothetical protein